MLCFSCCISLSNSKLSRRLSANALKFGAGFGLTDDCTQIYLFFLIALCVSVSCVQSFRSQPGKVYRQSRKAGSCFALRRHAGKEKRSWLWWLDCLAVRHNSRQLRGRIQKQHLVPCCCLVQLQMFPCGGNKAATVAGAFGLSDNLGGKFFSRFLRVVAF